MRTACLLTISQHALQEGSAWGGCLPEGGCMPGDVCLGVVCLGDLPRGVSAWGVQGLSVPFACVGSSDPVRVLCLYTMNTLDILWSIYCWDICTTTDANVLHAQALRSETPYWRMFSGRVLVLEWSRANCCVPLLLCFSSFTLYWVMFYLLLV